MQTLLRGRYVAAVQLALTLLCVGCGDGPATSPDSKPLDAVPQIPDAPSGPLAKVTVVNNPNDYDKAGSRVVFYLADGTVSKIATLDAEGVAEGYVNTGGSMTLIMHKLAIGTTPETVENRTVLGVAEGEAIEIGYRFPSTTSFSFIVDGPTYPGAASYRVTTYCNRGTSGSPVKATPIGLATMANGCAQADLLLQAQDSGGQPLASLFQQNVAVAANTTVTLTGAYAVPRQRSYRFSNIPAEVMSLTVLAFPHPFAPSYVTGIVPSAGSVTHIARFPETVPFEPHSNYTFLFPADGNSSVYYAAQDTFVGDVTFDARSAIAPRATAASLASDGRTISWTEVSGAEATATVAQFVFFGTSRDFRGSWSVLAPRGASTMVVPQLPAELALFGPQADDAKAIQFIEIEYVAGATYADFRQKSFATGSTFYREASIVRSSSYSPPEL